jgi:hypothetical protein
MILELCSSSSNLTNRKRIFSNLEGNTESKVLFQSQLRLLDKEESFACFFSVPSCWLPEVYVSEQLISCCSKTSCRIRKENIYRNSWKPCNICQTLVVSDCKPRLNLFCSTGFYNPFAGFSLLSLEVSRSHTRTHHSR